MTATIGSIQILFDTQYGAAINGIRRFASETERGGDRAGRSIKDIDRSAAHMNRTLSNLRTRQFNTLSLGALRASNSIERLRGILLATSTLFGGLSVAFAIKGVQQYVDQWNSVGNRLRIVKNESQDLSDIQDKIFAVAQRSRAQYDATALLFARIAQSAKRLNISQKDTLRVTETIQKAFVVGGSTPTEAAQSALQLSQGIASNRLQGDELRSVLENQALGQVIADQITGGDIGKLRKLAAEGKLTASTLIRAFKNASTQIDELFGTTTETIGQAFIKVDNALEKYIGTSDGVQKSSRATVNILEALAANLDTVADSLLLIGTAGAGVIGGKAFSGLTGFVSKQIALRKETLASSVAAMKEANAIQAATAAKLKDAEATYASARANAALGLSLEKAGKQLQAAKFSDLQATKAARVAAEDFNAVVKTQGVVATATAASVRGLGAAMNFLGGPVGLALIALGGIMFLMSKQAADAQARVDRYAEAIEKAGDNSEGAATGIREAGKAIEYVAKVSSEAERLVRLKQATEDVATEFHELRKEADLAFIQSGFDSGLQGKLQGLIDKAERGKISFEDFKDGIDDVAKANPDLAPIIAKMIAIAKTAFAAQGAVDGLSSSMKNLGPIGKSARPGSLQDTLNTPIPAGVTDALKGDLEKQKLKNIKEAIENGTADNLTARMYGDLAEFGSKAKKHHKTDAEKQVERFDKRITKLRQDANTMFFSDLDKDIIDTAQNFGVAADQIDAFIASGGKMKELPPQLAQIKTELEKIEQNKALVQFADDASQAFGDFFNDATDGAGSFGDALKNLATKLIDLVFQLTVVDPLVKSIKNSLLSGFGGGGGLLSFLGIGVGTSDPWSGLRTAASAKGNIFAGPGISAYSNSIVTKPTFFPFAKGIGLMGEELGSPGEAIMPLDRGPDGRLGVAANLDMLERVGNAGGGGLHVAVGVSVDNDGNLQAYVKDVAQTESGKAVASFAGSEGFVRSVGGAYPQAKSKRYIRGRG